MLGVIIPRMLERDRVLDAARYAASWIEYRQRSLGVPGVVVAVRHDDELVLHQAFGRADVEHDTAMTVDHVFRIASHSKTFTATAVLQLVERGLLRLDDAAGTFVDGLPADVAARTVRDLLSHASGLSRDTADAPWWGARRDFPDETELRALLSAEVPPLQANERFKYSNLGFSLLGLVVAAAAGCSYEAYVTENIVDRLGLTCAGPEPRGAVLERMATGYSSRRYGMTRRPIPHLDTGAMAAATGWYATAADLCEYGAAHFAGDERLLSDRSKRLMQAGAWDTQGGRGGRYGLGFHVYDVGDRRLVSHGGGFPGFITFTCIDPVDRLVVTVLTNAIDGPAEGLATTVVRMVNRAAGGRGGLDDALLAYEGRWFSEFRAVDIARLGDELLAMDPDLPDPLAEVTVLEPLGDAELRITEAQGYGSPGERVRFRDDHIQFAANRMVPFESFSRERE